MPRLRSVGKQAANPSDLAQLRDVNALASTAAATYVPLNSANQPNGYGKLDANSRLADAQMPQVVTHTTLTNSGKISTNTLDVTSTAALKGNATVGGTLGVTGALTAASLDVGTGTLKGASADIPSITSTNFAAKATTLDSLTVSGASSLAALTTSGDLSTQALSATAVSSSGGVTATGTVRGATVQSDGSLIVSGGSSLQGVTVAGQLSAQGIDAAARINAQAGLRLSASQQITQVDASNNAAPVQLGAGAVVNGPLSAVTTLTMSGALSVGSLSSSGAVSGTTFTGSGTATFNDIVSQTNLRVAGTVTGVTNLTVTGNITANGNNTQVNTFKITSLSAELTGQLTVASSMANNNVHMFLNGKSIRQYGDRFERYSPIDNGSTWQPNIAFSGQARTSSYQQGFSPNTDTIVNSWDTNLHGVADHTGAVINAGNEGLYGRANGVYLATFKMTLNLYVGRHYQTYFTVNGQRRTETFFEGTTGGGPASNNTADDYTTIQNIHVMRLTAGDIVRVVVQQRMGEKTSYPINNSFDRPEFSLTYLGAY